MSLASLRLHSRAGGHEEGRPDNETKLGNRGLSHSCSSRTKDDADRTDDGTDKEEGSHE